VRNNSRLNEVLAFLLCVYFDPILISAMILRITSFHVSSSGSTPVSSVFVHFAYYINSSENNDDDLKEKEKERISIHCH